jgi:hypothetical protein
VSEHEATVTLGALGKQRVRFDYTPGRPGCMYLRNGDPGYPEEPAELWIEEVCIGGIWINAGDFGEAVLDELFRPAEDELLEGMGARLQADADEADWDRQQERRMEEGYP